MVVRVSASAAIGACCWAILSLQQQVSGEAFLATASVAASCRQSSTSTFTSTTVRTAASSIFSIRGGDSEDEYDLDSDSFDDDGSESESEEEEPVFVAPVVVKKKKKSKSSSKTTKSKSKAKASSSKANASSTKLAASAVKSSQKSTKVQVAAVMAKTKVVHKRKKRRTKSLLAALSVPYVLRAFLNPFTVFAMTRCYFASLFNIHYMTDVSTYCAGSTYCHGCVCCPLFVLYIPFLRVVCD
jgi:hypothetical protein